MKILAQKDRDKQRSHARVMKKYFELRTEILLWRKLESYVNKKMKAKTSTKELEREINSVIKEKLARLKRMLKIKK